MTSKMTLMLCMSVFSVGAHAQIVSENFDARNVGDYMGIVSPLYWTTWSGVVGGQTDVQVTNARANSGLNSIRLASTDVNGGPQDVLIKLGQQFSSGIVTYQTAMYEVAGKRHISISRQHRFLEPNGH